MAHRWTFLPSAILVLSLASSRQATAETMTIAWDASLDPTVTGYVVSYGTQSGVHPTQVDVGNKTQATLPGLAAGTTYYFVVQSYNGLGQFSATSREVAGPAVSVTALVSSTRFPAPTGAAITWTALGSQGATLQYRFLRFSQTTGAWTIVQDYSPLATFTWTPL